jgi:hypothetical protein
MFNDPLLYNWNILNINYSHRSLIMDDCHYNIIANNEISKNVNVNNILLVLPLFAPDELRLQRNIDSIASVWEYMQKYNLKLNIVFGGWASSDNYWQQLEILVRDKFPSSVLVRFEKNYGKAVVVNKLVKLYSRDFHKFLFTMDSDILFILDVPEIFERLIHMSEISESSRKKSFGLIGLNQAINNCHLGNCYQNKIKYTYKTYTDLLVYPNDSHGIAGGCLFIGLNAWNVVNGYRILGVYAGDDGNLLGDLVKHNYSIQLADTISVIHPKEHDNCYQTWKNSVVANRGMYEKSFFDANEFWKNKKMNELKVDVPQDFNWKDYVNSQGLSYIKDEDTARRHYKLFHKYTANPGSSVVNYKNLDWKKYVNSYTDLQKSSIDSESKALEHWFKFGQYEGRVYNEVEEIDWKTYINRYTDLAASGVDTYEKALQHWKTAGKNEGRTWW